jgi:hypothetical protein
MVICANPATPVSCAPAPCDPSCPITADELIEQIAQRRPICPGNLRTARTDRERVAGIPLSCSGDAPALA